MKRFTEAEKDYMRDEYISGKSMTKISKELSSNRTSVRWQLDKMGLLVKSDKPCFVKGIDIVGQKIGRWSVLSRASLSNYFCACECGKTKEVARSRLLDGSSKSCGCYMSEVMSKLHTTHGLSGTAILNTYNNMVRRCTDPKHEKYALYGAKGITICGDWLESLDTFVSWSLENGFRVDFQLDRIDGKKGYSPDNCRYVSACINMLNRNFECNSGINGVRKVDRFKKHSFSVTLKYNGHNVVIKNIPDYFEACCTRKSLENFIYSSFQHHKSKDKPDDAVLRDYIVFLRERGYITY